MFALLLLSTPATCNCHGTDQPEAICIKVVLRRALIPIHDDAHVTVG